MKQTEKTYVNDPCPCGSGRKYKKCCMEKDQASSQGKGRLILAAVLIPAVVGLAIWQSATTPEPERLPASPAATPASTTAPAPPPSSPTPSSASSAPPSDSPEPWYFDHAKNQHWDPNHNHWHPGPPPADRKTAPPPSATITPNTSTPSISTTLDTPTGQTPAPWTYDAEKNQHWDPDHKHWHQGPPPKK